MLIVWGTHNFAKKLVGARRDFCNCCEHEVLTEQWQSFDMFHLYFIPLIPLGNRRRWARKRPTSALQELSCICQSCSKLFCILFCLFWGIVLINGITSW